MRKRFKMTDRNGRNYRTVCKTDNPKDIIATARSFIAMTGGQCKLLVEEIVNGEYLKTDMFDEAIDKLMTAYQWG